MPEKYDYYRTAGLLSQTVGKNDTILHETACMSPQMRKVYALLKAATKILNNKALTNFVTDTALPLIDAIGKADWQRDIVSDMGLRSPLTETEDTFPDGSTEPEPTAPE